jgi:hypothetical protein
VSLDLRGATIFLHLPTCICKVLYPTAKRVVFIMCQSHTVIHIWWKIVCLLLYCPMNTFISATSRWYCHQQYHMPTGRPSRTSSTLMVFLLHYCESVMHHCIAVRSQHHKDEPVQPPPLWRIVGSVSSVFASQGDDRIGNRSKKKETWLPFLAR